SSMPRRRRSGPLRLRPPKSLALAAANGYPQGSSPLHFRRPKEGSRMGQRVRLGGLAGCIVLLAVLLPSARGVAERDVEAAIERGVKYLRSQKAEDGSWRFTELETGNTTGATALAGLTLLECGAAKDDPDVQAAARFVRATGANLTNTYALSLGVLF